MSWIAGIDYSTNAIDVVLIDECNGRTKWHNYPLAGQDAFERTRKVKAALHNHWADDYWAENVLAVGIEDPRGYNSGALYRIQGAILAELPTQLLIQPWIPSVWRKAVGLPGNCAKAAVSQFVVQHKLKMIDGRDVSHVPAGALPMPDGTTWPQDACDAYCIALATRLALEKPSRLALERENA